MPRLRESKAAPQRPPLDLVTLMSARWEVWRDAFAAGLSVRAWGGSVLALVPTEHRHGLSRHLVYDVAPDGSIEDAITVFAQIDVHATNRSTTERNYES